MAIRDPKAFWKFEWNSNDSIGSVNWTDTGISYWTGKIDQCAINSTGNINLWTWNFGITNKMSISLWVNFSVWGNHTLISKSNWSTPATDSWYILPQLSSNVVQTFIGNGTTNTFVNHNCSLSTGVWTHIGFTYDWTTGNQKLYKDWVLVSTGWWWPSTINSSASSVYLMNYVTLTIPLNWKLDATWIWDVTLTDAEMDELWNWWNGREVPFLSEILNPEILLKFL